MPEPVTHQLYIAGRWVDSVSGGTFESVNPADTTDVVGRFQAGTAADVAMAIRAAEEASKAWKATPAPKRGELLYRFGALMAEHKERLARAMTREMGKVLAEARGDVQEGIDIAFLMAGEGRRMLGDAFSLRFEWGKWELRRASAQEVWEFAAESVPPLRAWLDEQDEERRAKVAEHYRTLFSGGLFRREYFIVLGQRT